MVKKLYRFYKVSENEAPSFLYNVNNVIPTGLKILRLFLSLMPVITFLKIYFFLQLLLNGLS